MTSNLGILLGSERRANALLSKLPLKNILFLSSHELHEAGLPYKTAQRLESAVSLVKQAMAETEETPVSLLNSEDVYNYIRPQCDYQREETFWVLCLNIRQHPLSIDTIGIGTIGETNVSLRRIVRTAFTNNAARIILIHNHPSGDPSPSEKDLELTQYIANAVEQLDIKVIDHIIIGHGRYVSLADKGEL